MRYLKNGILLILVITTLVYGPYNPMIKFTGNKPCHTYDRENCCGHTENSSVEYASTCIIPISDRFNGLNKSQCESELWAIKHDPHNIGLCDNGLMTFDVDYQGNDISNSIMDVAFANGPDECQKLCDKKPECRFWTADKYVCYLKHSKLGYTNKEGPVSGSKYTGQSVETRLRSDLKEKNTKIANLEHNHKKEMEDLKAEHNKKLSNAMEKIPLYYLIVGICALVLLFTLVIGIIVYYCWKKYKQSHQKKALGDLKPSPTLSEILRKTTIARERSYESMDSQWSTRTREKPGYTPTNTNTTYFVAKHQITEEQKSKMQMLSLSQPRPVLSGLRGIKYKPNVSNISKFSSPLEQESCSENEKIEEEFSQEGENKEIDQTNGEQN